MPETMDINQAMEIATIIISFDPRTKEQLIAQNVLLTLLEYIDILEQDAGIMKGETDA